MKYLNSFNENFLSIDINKIKENANKFYTTKECRIAMSEIDINTLNNAIKEVEKLKSKYKSIESAIKKLISKSETQNEGIAGTIMLTIFGLHAFIKLLVAIKNGWSFGRYIRGWFYTSQEDLSTVRDAAIMVTYLIYVIVFIVGENKWSSDAYKINKTDMYMGLEYKYDGIHNYTIRDDFGKLYHFKRIGFGKWDIYNANNKLIGKCIKEDIYDTNNQPIAFSESISNEDEKNYIEKHYIKIDLEKILTKVKQKDNRAEIEKRNIEIKKLYNEIDSLNRKTFENIDITRKILNEKGIDYDSIEDNMDNYSDPDRILAKGVIELKYFMTKNNNLGYLSTFTNFLIEGIKKSHDQNISHMRSVINIYKRLVDIGNLSEKLRDSEGNIKKVVEFTTLESLNDAISRVLDWQKVNSFIKGFPPTQKRLIWENGYYTEELKSISQYLTRTIISIVSNETAKNNFLSKISSIKDKESLINILSSISNKDPWDYKHWESKLENGRNIIVTWKSESEKMIICSVFTHEAIKKIAYMTNWCIFRYKDYFNKYQSKGYQFILYDFSKDERDNKSVIGFTTTPSYRITDCNDKNDHRTSLPYSIWPHSKSSKVIKEYVNITIKSMFNKLDSSLWAIVKNKIKNVLSNQYIADFLDFYDDGTI